MPPFGSRGGPIGPPEGATAQAAYWARPFPKDQFSRATVEIKFRRNIRPADVQGVRSFRSRFHAPWGLVVTRDHFDFPEGSHIGQVPLLDFPLAF